MIKKILLWSGAAIPAFIVAVILYNVPWFESLNGAFDRWGECTY